LSSKPKSDQELEKVPFSYSRDEIYSLFTSPSVLPDGIDSTAVVISSQPLPPVQSIPYTEEEKEWLASTALPSPKRVSSAPPRARFTPQRGLNQIIFFFLFFELK